MIFKHVSLYTERKGIDMEDNTNNSSKLLHCSFCGKNQKEVKKLKPKEEKMETQADLTKQLDSILGNLRDVINKRNQKIADLRAEIEKLEQENTELDGKINSILSDI